MEVDVRKTREAGMRFPSYQEWCKTNHVSHAHCPNLCDKPQPFFGECEYALDGGALWCGRCYVKGGILQRVEPCVGDDDDCGGV